MGPQFLLGIMKRPGVSGQGCTTPYSKNESYSFNGWIVWCVSYTLVKLLKSEVQDTWESNLEYKRGSDGDMYQ